MSFRELYPTINGDTILQQQTRWPPERKLSQLIRHLLSIQQENKARRKLCGKIQLFNVLTTVKLNVISNSKQTK